jgi:hypothetical protein
MATEIPESPDRFPDPEVLRGGCDCLDRETKEAEDNLSVSFAYGDGTFVTDAAAVERMCRPLATGSGRVVI